MRASEYLGVKIYSSRIQCDSALEVSISSALLAVSKQFPSPPSGSNKHRTHSLETEIDGNGNAHENGAPRLVDSIATGTIVLLFNIKEFYDSMVLVFICIAVEIYNY
jgi:hypothetical protein